MRYTLLFLLSLGACAPEYNITHDEPVAGSVAVKSEALKFRSCASVMTALKTTIKTCKGCCSAGGGWCAFGSPSIYDAQYSGNVQHWAMGYSSSDKAKQGLCYKSSGKILQTFGFPYPATVNLTNTQVTYP